MRSPYGTRPPMSTRTSRKLTPRGTRGYERTVPARLPLRSQRLVVITGKGGVGKTTVTAALARAVAGAGRRVLAVEIGSGSLGTLLDAERIGAEPVRVDTRLFAAA